MNATDRPDIGNAQTKINHLRDALESIAEGMWSPDIAPHVIIGEMRQIAKTALGAAE